MKLNKRLIIIILFFSILSGIGFTHQVKAATPGKIAVLFSEKSEKYADIVRSGGTLNGVAVSPKVNFSSIYDKELKIYHLYKEQGYQVDKISEKDLLNPLKLTEYESIVFPYTVMMSSDQRQNVKNYIRDGGGAIFAFGTARNESASFPNEGQMDLSALIYHTKTWIWEWDNLSEVFQSKFINDVILKNYQITTSNKTHPIIKNTLNELKKSDIELTNKKSSGDWVEVISPYNVNAVPLLKYNSFSYSSSPQHTPTNTGAAYAISYGNGRMVFAGFKIYDHIEVKVEDTWEDTTKGLAYSSTTGEQDAEIFLKHALKWTMENVEVRQNRKYDIQLQLNDLRGYLRANDYVIYGSVKTENNGNVPIRGTMIIEVLNQSGTILANYTRYYNGLTPDHSINSSHTEKFQLLLPKSIKQGNYQVRTIFHEGKENKKGYKVKSETKQLSIGKGPAIFSNTPFFYDVSRSNGAYLDIANLSNLKIIRGFPDGSFKPLGHVTRLQAAEMMLKSLNIPISDKNMISATDIKRDSYGYNIIATAHKYGMIDIKNGKIRAFEAMTRGEMAKALVSGYHLTAYTNHQFNDIGFNNEFKKDIQTIYALGVTTGFTDGSFKPNQFVTRAQFSSFINRSLVAVQK